MSPPAGQAPKRHPISVNEHLRMGESRVLAPEARVELIEGEIIDMSPVGPPHASTTNRLNRIFSEALGARVIVSVQNPIVLGDLSAPQPDMALLKPRDDFYEATHPEADDVLLLVEIADSSLSHDRDRKLPLYARFGIPEVWLIDVEGRHLDVHRDPDGGRYATQFRVHDLARVEVLALPGVVLDLRSLL
jgi:Uma2 family endonuclease